MCSNFSAISAQLTRKGLRRRPEGELIDLGAVLPLGERGTGQGRMKAQRGKYALERIAEKMVGNGREWLIDLGQGPVRTEKRLREKWDEARRS